MAEPALQHPQGDIPAWDWPLVSGDFQAWKGPLVSVELLLVEPLTYHM